MNLRQKAQLERAGIALTILFAFIILTVGIVIVKNNTEAKPTKVSAWILTQNGNIYSDKDIFIYEYTKGTLTAEHLTALCTLLEEGQQLYMQPVD